MVRIDNRLSEGSNFYGKSAGEVGDFNLLWYFWLRQLCRVNHVRLTLNERPFEGLLRSVDVETLAILSGGVIQKTPNMSGDVNEVNCRICQQVVKLDEPFFNLEGVGQFV